MDAPTISINQHQAGNYRTSNDFFLNQSVNIKNKLNQLLIIGKEGITFTQFNAENRVDGLRNTLKELFGPIFTLVHILACIVNKISMETIKETIDNIKEHVMVKMDGRTILHLLFEKNYGTPYIVNRLIEIGGDELIMAKSTEDSRPPCPPSTALHWALIKNKANVKVINLLIASGGKSLVIEKQGSDGLNALHIACKENIKRITIIKELIKVGGKELIMESSEDGTALNYACKLAKINPEVINALIDEGGRELVEKVSRGDRNILIALLQNKDTSFDLMKKIIDLGWKRYDNYILIHVLRNEREGNEDGTINMFRYLIKRGIELEGWEESSFGGLFSVRITDRHWNKIILPTLESEDLALCDKHPILHAAIISKADPRIVKDIATRFNCITTKDSSGRYPVHVAVECGVKWDEGMREIFLKSMANPRIERLYPNILAATGKNNDLNTIFNMVRQTPHLVGFHGTSSNQQRIPNQETDVSKSGASGKRHLDDALDEVERTEHKRLKL